MTKKIVEKAFINKKNNQISVNISRKKLKKINPKLKFGEELFVSLEVFNKKNK